LNFMLWFDVTGWENISEKVQRWAYSLLCYHMQYVIYVGTVDNHEKKTETTVSVIFVKCRECCDFAKMPRFLPKCRSFTFWQEYFVFNQHNLKFIQLYCVNLTQKHLPFLCLCYQSPCALLLTGRICDRDVTVVCILPSIYFSGLGNHEF